MWFSSSSKFHVFSFNIYFPEGYERLMATLNPKTKRVKKSKRESSVDFRGDILLNRNMQETMIVGSNSQINYTYSVCFGANEYRTFL